MTRSALWVVERTLAEAERLAQRSVAVSDRPALIAVLVTDLAAYRELAVQEYDWSLTAIAALVLWLTGNSQETPVAALRRVREAGSLLR